MDNIIFFIYIIGCLVAFLFIEHETRDIENADTAMMSFFCNRFLVDGCCYWCYQG